MVSGYRQTVFVGCGPLAEKQLLGSPKPPPQGRPPHDRSRAYSPPQSRGRPGRPCDRGPQSGRRLEPKWLRILSLSLYVNMCICVYIYVYVSTYFYMVARVVAVPCACTSPARKRGDHLSLLRITCNFPTRERALSPKKTPWCLGRNGGMDCKDYHLGLYRDYYKDPFPHSLLSTSKRSCL